LLAEKLAAYKGKNPLVLAIPRGAVPMAKLIAEALGGEFDVVLVRKLGAPGNPEFAIGAIDETGWAYLGPDATMAGADEAYIERVKARELQTIRNRRAQYSPLHPPIDPAGPHRHCHRRRPRHRLDHARRPACPAPARTAEAGLRRAGGAARHPGEVAEKADEVVCLYAPENFQAVGQFYADFGQVEDDEVVALLSGRRDSPERRTGVE
jgi:putative phosphoribosyl transferase